MSDSSRTFLKVLAAAMALFVLAGCREELESVFDDVTSRTKATVTRSAYDQYTCGNRATIEIAAQDMLQNSGIGGLALGLALLSNPNMDLEAELAEFGKTQQGHQLKEITVKGLRVRYCSARERNKPNDDPWCYKVNELHEREKVRISWVLCENPAPLKSTPRAQPEKPVVNDAVSDSEVELW